MSDARLAVHVYHPDAAEALAALVRARARERAVIAIADERELSERLPAIEVLFAPRPPRGGWAGASRLRLVQLAGVGADHFLPAEGLADHVEVAGLRGLFAEAMAEHAMTLLLALARDLPGFLADARAGQWRQRAVQMLGGRRLVVLGLGAAGACIAARAAGLGMRVTGVCRRPRPVAHVERAFGAGDLLAALEGADALVVAVPLTEGTRGLIDARALAALEDDAILVDVSRGGVVDEAALLATLAEGRLRVAKDVFEEEPLPEDSPFWTAPRTLVTPHIAGYREGYLEGAVDVLLDNVARLEAGQPRQRLVDRAAGY